MIVANTESVVVAAAAEAVFDHAFDPEHLAALLGGWGPVPAVARVDRLDAGPYAIGSKRRIHNSDGSVLDEEVLVHEPPRRHGYRLFGEFGGLAKLLVREGRGDWEFHPTDAGETLVRWRYEFTLTTPLAWPLGVVMMKVAFANMQRRALGRLRAVWA
jgi:hypothetical protein